MAKVICFGNQKGGVTKTTTTLNIATQLALRGYKTLMVDSDPQASLTIISGFYNPEEMIGKNLPALLDDEDNRINIHDCIYPVLTFNTNNKLFLIPSEIELSNGELSYVSRPGNDKLLSNRLDEISDDFDFICIDCPPSLGILQVNDISASDYIIGCVEPRFQALRGIEYYVSTIAKFKKRLLQNTQFLGLIISKIGRDNDSSDIVEALESQYTVLGKISNSVEVSKGEIDGVPISVRKKSHISSLEYYNITTKILEITNTK